MKSGAEGPTRSALGPAVELRGVVALLGSFPALAGMDLRVERGEVAVLRGDNGAGKSTALKVVAGLVAVTRGSVEVLGSDVRVDRRSVRRHLAMLGHATGLYPDLTVEENVRFAAAATARPGGGDIGPRVSGAMQRLGLDGRLAGLRVAHLSAGQRRRTALAAMVARDVALWLLDEPHAALDEPGRYLLDELVGEASERGTSVLIASHDLERVASLADRVHVVAGGRIAESIEGGRHRRPADRSSAAW